MAAYILAFAILEDGNHFSAQKKKKVISILYLNKDVSVLLGFPIFQDEKQAQKVLIFRKELKKKIAPVRGVSLTTCHRFLSATFWGVSPRGRCFRPSVSP